MGAICSALSVTGGERTEERRGRWGALLGDRDARRDRSALTYALAGGRQSADGAWRCSEAPFVCRGVSSPLVTRFRRCRPERWDRESLRCGGEGGQTYCADDSSLTWILEGGRRREACLCGCGGGEDQLDTCFLLFLPDPEFLGRLRALEEGREEVVVAKRKGTATDTRI